MMTALDLFDLGFSDQSAARIASAGGLPWELRPRPQATCPENGVQRISLVEARVLKRVCKEFKEYGHMA